MPVKSNHLKIVQRKCLMIFVGYFDFGHIFDQGFCLF